MFILGFTLVFVMLGAVATEVGQLAREYKKYLTWVAGAVVIIFGLHLTGILKIKALYADKRLHSIKGGKSPIGAFRGRFCLCLRMDSLPGAVSFGHFGLCRQH